MEGSVEGAGGVVSMGLAAAREGRLGILLWTGIGGLLVMAVACDLLRALYCALVERPERTLRVRLLKLMNRVVTLAFLFSTYMLVVEYAGADANVASSTVGDDAGILGLAGLKGTQQVYLLVSCASFVYFFGFFGVAFVFQDVQQGGHKDGEDEQLPGATNGELSDDMQDLLAAGKGESKGKGKGKSLLDHDSPASPLPSPPVGHGGAAAAGVPIMAPGFNEYAYARDTAFARLRALCPEMDGPVKERETALRWERQLVKHAVTVETTMLQNSPWAAVRAHCRMATDVYTLRQLITDKFDRFDPLVREQRELTCPDERTTVRWVAYKPVWWLQSRDFVCLTSWQPRTDGFIVASMSVMHPEAPQTQTKDTRGRVFCAGYHVRQVSAEECDVTMVMHIDPRGYIPAWMVNLLITTGPLDLLVNLRNLARAQDDSEFTPSVELVSQLARLIEEEERIRQHAVMETDADGMADGYGTPVSAGARTASASSASPPHGPRSSATTAATGPTATVTTSSTIPAMGHAAGPPMRNNGGAPASWTRETATSAGRTAAAGDGPVHTSDPDYQYDLCPQSAEQADEAMAEVESAKTKLSTQPPQDKTLGEAVADDAFDQSDDVTVATAAAAEPTPEQIEARHEQRLLADASLPLTATPAWANGRPDLVSVRHEALARLVALGVCGLGRQHKPSFVPNLLTVDVARLAQSMGISWEHVLNRKDTDVFRSTVVGSGWQALRARKLIRASPASVYSFLADDTNCAKFDDMFDKFEQYIAQPDETTVVRRACFKPIWPTSPRDFYVLTTSRPCVWRSVHAEGSDEAVGYMIATRSAGLPKQPEVSGYVRGQVLVSGFLIRPVKAGIASLDVEEQQRQEDDDDSKLSEDGTGDDFGDRASPSGLSTRSAPTPHNSSSTGRARLAAKMRRRRNRNAAAAAAATDNEEEGLWSDVIMVAHTDLGGTLPRSVINFLSSSAPVSTLNAVARIVEGQELEKRMRR